MDHLGAVPALGDVRPGGHAASRRGSPPNSCQAAAGRPHRVRSGAGGPVTITASIGGEHRRHHAAGDEPGALIGQWPEAGQAPTQLTGCASTFMLGDQRAPGTLVDQRCNRSRPDEVPGSASIAARKPPIGGVPTTAANAGNRRVGSDAGRPVPVVSTVAVRPAVRATCARAVGPGGSGPRAPEQVHWIRGIRCSGDVHRRGTPHRAGPA